MECEKMSANILLIYNYRAEQLTFKAFTVEKHVFDFLFTKERKLKRGQMISFVWLQPYV